MGRRQHPLFGTSLPEVFCIKANLKIFKKFTGKHLRRRQFLVSKVECVKLQLNEKHVHFRFFSVIFVQFFRESILQNICTLCLSTALLFHILLNQQKETKRFCADWNSVHYVIFLLYSNICYILFLFYREINFQNCM